jgi:hypothetical protein
MRQVQEFWIKKGGPYFSHPCKYTKSAFAGAKHGPPWGIHIGDLLSLNPIIHQRSKFWQGIWGNFHHMIFWESKALFHVYVEVKKA